MRSRFSFSEFHKKRKRPLLLDGAIGSVLQTELEQPNSPLWSSQLAVTDSSKIYKLHKEYIESGANIITTNTFRTNPAAIKQSNSKVDSRNLVLINVELAIKARRDKEVMIAGSNAPAEDCYQKERFLNQNELLENHQKHIEYLWESGVDFILNETMSHSDEIKIVSEICSKKEIPFIVSLYLNDKLELLSGESLNEIIKLIENYNPIAIGINCISPDIFSSIDHKLIATQNWGFYLNCGSGNVTDKSIACGISPAEYIEEVQKYLNYNPVFIGTCCGSNPAHTKALKEYFDEIYSN